MGREIEVSFEDICKGKLREHYTKGLLVLALCNDGSGRSLNVAQALANRHEIPAGYVSGGLCRLSDPEWTTGRSAIATDLNLAPLLQVILTPIEMLEYGQLLFQLRASRYTNSTQAINSAVRTFGK